MSSSSVTPFSFDEAGIRVVMLEDEPWFVAADICTALGISDTRRVVERLDEADWRQTPIMAGGQERWMYAVNESGLYEMVIRSDKPDARRFRRWVTNDVLPQIRKTGSYSIVPVQPTDNLAIMEMMIAQIRQDEARIAAVESGQRVLEAKVSASQGEYGEFTALAYAKINGLPTDRISCQRHGQRASRLLKARRQEPRKVEDSTFGTINVYPVDVLDETVER